MKSRVVVDIGNTCMKWGLCQNNTIVKICSLPHEDVTAWEQQISLWELPRPLSWVITGVVPQKRSIFADWLQAQGHHVQLLIHPQQLPLRISLERPERAGIDRLLDAVAANGRRPRGTPAIVVDIGSATTVDLIDSEGCFRGGAILPGLRLMIQSLHDYTALLPRIEIPRHAPAVPGLSTTHALELGVFWAVTGGILALIAEYQKECTKTAVVFVTGGDASIVAPKIPDSIHWPTMTLEGIRLSAEALP